MPLKSDAVKDLDKLAKLPFSKVIVKLNPNLYDTVLISIIRLNSSVQNVGSIKCRQL
jgi:hypothetical protein